MLSRRVFLTESCQWYDVLFDDVIDNVLHHTKYFFQIFTYIAHKIYIFRKITHLLKVLVVCSFIPLLHPNPTTQQPHLDEAGGLGGANTCGLQGGQICEVTYAFQNGDNHNKTTK